MVSSLQYLKLTWPNIAFVVYYVSQFMQVSCESHLIATKRIFHYLKGTLNIGLHYVRRPLTTMTSYCGTD